ncbi:MAG TPA: cytochrome B [Idiomarina baltica]|jgi:cytochrome b561|uniref:Cytochrome B n=3 Tax=Idiomarina TaxID=135575 RepID=A0A348WR79_9GAMM|nr:cytochrome b/b6 domain-containing protein [Idiomarina sp. T82-3]KXS36443.1 MAG: Cytochrome B561 [Idiomarina sp. T82-3]HAR57041.1 cytochrome B [Idiomarina baltica]
MNTSTHYSALAQFMHWLTVIALSIMLTLGFMMVFADERTFKHAVEGIHVTTGFYLGLFLLVRIGFRAFAGFRAPEPDEQTTFKLAKGLQSLMLLTLLVVLITGPLYLFTEGEGIALSSQTTWLIDLSGWSWLHEPAEEIHKILATYVLPSLIALHMLAAIKQFHREVNRR